MVVVIARCLVLVVLSVAVVVSPVGLMGLCRVRAQSGIQLPLLLELRLEVQGLQLLLLQLFLQVRHLLHELRLMEQCNFRLPLLSGIIHRSWWYTLTDW